MYCTEYVNREDKYIFDEFVNDFKPDNFDYDFDRAMTPPIEALQDSLFSSNGEDIFDLDLPNLSQLKIHNSHESESCDVKYSPFGHFNYNNCEPAIKAENSYQFKNSPSYPSSLIPSESCSNSFNNNDNWKSDAFDFQRVDSFQKSNLDADNAKKFSVENPRFLSEAFQALTDNSSPFSSNCSSDEIIRNEQNFNSCQPNFLRTNHYQNNLYYSQNNFTETADQSPNFLKNEHFENSFSGSTKHLQPFLNSQNNFSKNANYSTYIETDTHLQSQENISPKVSQNEDKKKPRTRKSSNSLTNEDKYNRIREQNNISSRQYRSRKTDHRNACEKREEELTILNLKLKESSEKLEEKYNSCLEMKEKLRELGYTFNQLEY